MDSEVSLIRYDRKHLATPVVIALIIALGVIISFSFAMQEYLWLPILGVAVFALLLCTYSRRVQIDDLYLVVSYGVGLIKGVYEIHYVQSATVVDNDNLISWVFAPTTTHAAKIIMRDGKVLVLGSEDPRRILELVSARNR